MSTQEPRSARAGRSNDFDVVVGRDLPEWAVDFVKLDLIRDLPKGIFLTVKLAQEHELPAVRAMYPLAKGFMRDTMKFFDRGDDLSLARARSRFRIPEPREYRFGYTTNGSRGHGVGEGDLRADLFAELLANRELRDALREEPDSLSLVKNFGLDRVSDVMGVVIKALAVDYTNWCIDFYQFDPACLEVRAVQHCWLGEEKGFGVKTARVPVDANGEIFLLVPQGICRSGPAMNARQYFRNTDSPPGAAEGLSMKERMLRDAAQNPGRLSAFVEDRMKDSAKYQPRKEYRRER